MHFDIDVNGSLIDADFGDCKLGPLLQLIRERSIRLYPKEAPLPPNDEPVTADWIRRHGLQCRQLGHPQIKLWALRVPGGVVVMCPETPGSPTIVPYTVPSVGYALTDALTPHGATCLSARWCENFLYVT